MQTRSSLHRHPFREPSDRPVANIQSRSWGESLPQSAQPVQLKGTEYRPISPDLFSHDPGPRSYPKHLTTAQPSLIQASPIHNRRSEQPLESTIQREEDENDDNQPVSFDHELQLDVAKLEDKDGVRIPTQAISLELSLGTQALSAPQSKKFKFSFGKLKLGGVLSAVAETDIGAPTNATVQMGASASLSVAEVKLKSSSLFLPAGSTIKLGGKLEGTVDVSTGTLETKAKPTIGIQVPLSKKVYLDFDLSPGVEYGGKLGVSF